jgi:hypothetical protein
MTVARRLDEVPDFRHKILPHLCTNGTGPGRHGRNPRIEVREPATPEERRFLLQVEVRCVVCGRAMRAIRERKAAPGQLGALYLAVSCEQAARPACSRTSSRTSAEVERIIDLIHGYEDPRQPSLFVDLLSGLRADA